MSACKFQEAWKEYLEKNGGFVNTIIYFEDGKGDEEYVDMVADLLESTGQSEVNTTLGVKTGDGYIFFKEINVHDGNPVENIDKERIPDEITVTGQHRLNNHGGKFAKAKELTEKHEVSNVTVYQM